MTDVDPGMYPLLTWRPERSLALVVPFYSSRVPAQAPRQPVWPSNSANGAAARAGLDFRARVVNPPSDTLLM